jgi:hypothetical protein
VQEELVCPIDDHLNTSFTGLTARIILWKHKWINIVRCLLLPIAYSVFFAEAIVGPIDLIALYCADHQNFFTTAGVVRRSFMAIEQMLINSSDQVK